MYCSPSYLCCNNMNIKSTSGVRQGDPISSYLFALGMNSVLIQIASNFPSVKTLAYLDDLFILTNKSQIDKITSFLVKELAAISLDLNQEKTEILSLPLGGEILGCFFGNCTTKHLLKTKDSLTESIHLTRHIDIQSALLLIRFCINSKLTAGLQEHATLIFQLNSFMKFIK
ncbi:hypothetical protein GEMRC1_012527 [Eukaryota sp. GEM-RC1]